MMGCLIRGAVKIKERILLPRAREETFDVDLYIKVFQGVIDDEVDSSVAPGSSMVNIYPLWDGCHHRQNVLGTAGNTASS